MHPVARGLVLAPEQWNWSSYRHDAAGEYWSTKRRKRKLRVRGIPELYFFL
jgi:hypothetical protein